ncbi:MAG: stage III sporulation AC/AD family protein [Clostridiales bacterium]|nr:stage III sporulation AC/AD family protein [Clostridiales bacterium]MCD7827332.1 stage III sporulation AC/AD family protein [Clostridiales bacterium]
MIKLAGAALLSAVVCLIVRRYSPEYAVVTEIGAVLLILFMAFPYLSEITEFFSGYAGSAEIGSDYLETVLRAFGAAVITQFSADICRDTGETALASKVEFAGKTIVIAMTIPMAKAIIELAYTVI